MKICKLYISCVHKDTCKYAQPNDYPYNIRKDSLCYGFVKEEYYIKYLREKKLEILNNLENEKS